MSVGHQSVCSLLMQVYKHLNSLQNTFGHKSVYSLLTQMNKHLYSLQKTKISYTLTLTLPQLYNKQMYRLSYCLLFI